MTYEVIFGYRPDTVRACYWVRLWFGKRSFDGNATYTSHNKAVAAAKAIGATPKE